MAQLGLAAQTARTYAQFARSEEHTSELQSRLHLVCRLLLEKKKKHTHSNSCSHRSQMNLIVTIQLSALWVDGGTPLTSLLAKPVCETSFQRWSIFRAPWLLT